MSCLNSYLRCSHNLRRTFRVLNSSIVSRQNIIIGVLRSLVMKIICSSKCCITAIFTLSAAQNMVLQLSSHYLQLKIWYYSYLHIICSSKYGITAIFTLSAAQNMVLRLSSHYLQLQIWYYGYLHIICSSKYGITAISTPYRIAVAPPQKSYKIGLLFTHKNVCESELSGAWTGTH